VAGHERSFNIAAGGGGARAIDAAALAAAIALAVPAAAPARAHSRIVLSDGDQDWRDGRRPYRNDRGDRRYRDRDRDGIPDRFDRHDNRRRHWGPDNRYGYRDQPRCWSETRQDRWRGARYRVRVCR
jgi:hypothetical protein